MKIVVIGATGVLGRNVIPRLQERGHHVRAIVRIEQQAVRLRALGIEAVTGDILDANSLLSAVAGCEAVLHLATAIPKSGSAADWSLNDRIRREGTRNLLTAATHANVRRYVQQSIIMLYGDQGQRIMDESTPLQPAPYIQSAVDMERQVQASALDWSILRGGYFYGPGTDMEESWRDAARQGNLHLPGDGSGLISLIHVVDMARAAVLATESTLAGSIFNVVDDEPVTYRDLYSYVAAQIGAPPPQPARSLVRPSLACSNHCLKAQLGWSLAYPTYRAGLV